MSIVSSVILQIGIFEDAFDDDAEHRPGLEAFTSWLDGHDQPPLAELTDYMGGGKDPQTTVFGGGYNLFPEDEFAEFVMSFDWQHPENVVLIINPEEGPTRVWRPNRIEG